MISPLKAAVAAILFASSAFASGNVNVNVNSNSVYSDRITEVEVAGGGTYVFPDPFTAPDLSQSAQALETALAALGSGVWRMVHARALRRALSAVARRRS